MKCSEFCSEPSQVGHQTGFSCLKRLKRPLPSVSFPPPNYRLRVTVYAPVYTYSVMYTISLPPHISIAVYRCRLTPKVNIDVHIDEHHSSLILNTISKLERIQPDTHFHSKSHTLHVHKCAQLQVAAKILPPTEVMSSAHKTRCVAIFLTSANLSHILTYMS